MQVDKWLSLIIETFVDYKLVMHVYQKLIKKLSPLYTHLLFQIMLVVAALVFVFLMISNAFALLMVTS
jgi:hypothetical protein